MIQVAILSRQHLDRIRALAGVILAGSSESPAPGDLSDFDQLVLRATAALDGEATAIEAAVSALPEEISWASVSAFAEREPASFELVSLLVVGAYFMASPVLASLGVPTGQRRPANREQVVDELGEGLLDSVLERGSPIRTLEDVNSGTAS